MKDLVFEKNVPMPTELEQEAFNLVVPDSFGISALNVGDSFVAPKLVSKELGDALHYLRENGYRFVGQSINDMESRAWLIAKPGAEKICKRCGQNIPTADAGHTGD